MFHLWNNLLKEAQPQKTYSKCARKEENAAENKIAQGKMFWKAQFFQLSLDLQKEQSRHWR